MDLLKDPASAVCQRNGRFYSTVCLPSLKQSWPGIAIKHTSIGRHIVTTEPFKKGAIVCDYHGKLVRKKAYDELSALHKNDCKKTEVIDKYSMKIQVASIVLYVFAHDEDGSFGRLINHCPTHENIELFKARSKTCLHAIFRAKVDIPAEFDCSLMPVDLVNNGEDLSVVSGATPPEGSSAPDSSTKPLSNVLNILNEDKILSDGADPLERNYSKVSTHNNEQPPETSTACGAVSKIPTKGQPLSNLWNVFYEDEILSDRADPLQRNYSNDSSHNDVQSPETLAVSNVDSKFSTKGQPLSNVWIIHNEELSERADPLERNYYEVSTHCTNQPPETSTASNVVTKIPTKRIQKPYAVLSPQIKMLHLWFECFLDRTELGEITRAELFSNYQHAIKSLQQVPFDRKTFIGRMREQYLAKVVPIGCKRFLKYVGITFKIPQICKSITESGCECNRPKLPPLEKFGNVFGNAILE